MNKLKSLLLVLLMGVSTVSWAQTTVTGTVLDEQNVPLPGANVVVKNTTNGVVTDFDGNFSISVSNTNAVLVISYIGYVGKEVKLDGSSSYTITLEEDATGLEEVVVIGYGTVKKSDLTGAVASLDTETLTEQKKTDLGQAIQGRVAGVDVRTTNNKPGAPLSIDIRGNTVIKNNDATRDGLSDNLDDDLSKPLYVVDGVFFENINILNPSDIQQMDVLKDASATAIYGARGANGVIIITTKNGIEGKTVFTYEATVGLNTATNVPDMYNGDEYVNFVDNVLRSTAWRQLFNPSQGIYPTVEDYNNLTVDMSREIRTSNEEADNVANRRYTDWADDYRHAGIQTSHSLGMSGGSNGLTYNGSIGYLSNEGVVGIEGYDRYNLSASLTKKVSNSFTVGLKAYLALSERETGSNELFRSTLRLAPTVNSRDPEGNIILFPDDQDGRFLNPYYESQGSWLSNTKTLDVIANIFLNYKPADWISFKTQFAPNIQTERYGSHFGLLTKSARNEPSRTRAYYNAYFNTAYTWDNIVDFDFDLAQGHNLKTTLISSVYYNQREFSAIETRDFDTDAYSFYNTGAGLDPRAYNTNYYKETLASFAGRLNYSILDKYLFTFTGRYDGSSKLALNNEWAFFPSAAFAWKASDEAFLQDAGWLNNLKFRVSYGESGNDSPVSAYSSLAFLGESDYLFGDSHTNGVDVNGLPNNTLTWERSKEVNIGMDLSILKNRIGLGVEVYNKKTVDAILNKTLSNITGYSTAVGNYGSVQNRGVEITLNTVNVQTDKFRWKTSLNFAKNENQILKLDGDLEKEPYGNHGVLQVGQPVDAIYSYEIEGIWQLDEAAEAFAYDGSFPGQNKYRDLDNSGDRDENDKKVIGSISPDWIGGMTNTFTYGNLDLSIQAYTRQGSFGHSEFYNNFVPWQNDDAKFNKVNLDYWTPNNPDSKNPALEYGATGDNYYTNYDFVKIGNIGLGYQFPQEILDKLKMSSLRLSLDVQNPFTFTDYAGPDPETGLQNSYNAGYMVKTVLFGLKLAY
ncbi:TonB-linked outer membrane protein, SusC/RagA family [Arenibacter palladensis]|uniref:TonB-linked outer membrane protein, SusC/RagA family n=1 Tax=Arenibacter palladensis TaxID=237373 RepID=A0A1M4YAD1_9FLAO|nr:TonB-dependent receptor [Arenibacter palladensis]SHF02747.1 TonB-linked outer membrane protein, SusC/RagA family [Arenibacter palladensis]